MCTCQLRLPLVNPWLQSGCAGRARVTEPDQSYPGDRSGDERRDHEVQAIDGVRDAVTGRSSRSPAGDARRDPPPGSGDPGPEHEPLHRPDDSPRHSARQSSLSDLGGETGRLTQAHSHCERKARVPPSFRTADPYRIFTGKDGSK